MKNYILKPVTPQPIQAIQHNDIDETIASIAAAGYTNDVDVHPTDGSLTFDGNGNGSPVAVAKGDYLKFDNGTWSSQSASDFEAAYEEQA